MGLKKILIQHKPSEFINVIHVLNEDEKYELPEELFIDNYFPKLETIINSRVGKDDYKFINKEKSGTNKSTMEIIHSMALEERSNYLVV